MKEHIKSFLNEEQDPKAIEKITNKLNDLLMRNEEVGYIGVQKKPAINVFPDSIVLTNKRIIMCKPKNLGLSMDFTDYPWENVGATFVKENILGSEFSFTTNTDITISIDYLPKTQARKIYTFAKEQLELLKEGTVQSQSQFAEPSAQSQSQSQFAQATPEVNEVEEVETEEVNDFAEIMPAHLDAPQYFPPQPEEQSATPVPAKDSSLANLSKEELFEKLQNYKKLLDNGLILQGEYDTLKKEILAHL
ncbi:PH domain-containing protein [Flavobacterium sp. J372]|uniref:PH domain-containing protein n=1 Tax=Flavobacterium sp. J372 TaxID=2898436 RepID=UPI002150D885|nr:PH domain-containing protein [Flavobacterium sp. J372]MCR5860743.1 PH domain-containing protein [Flavobacterium sp. J372]